MKADEGFHKRWELRSSNADLHTSCDEQVSDPRGKSVASYDEGKADGDPGSHSHSAIHSQAVKSSKKKSKRKHDFDNKAMLDDLKIFADSLVQELAVAKQDMFASMRDEMSKLVASVKKASPVKRRKVASNEVSKGDRVALNMNPAPSHYIASRLQNRRNYNGVITTHIPYMASKTLFGQLEGFSFECRPYLPFLLHREAESGGSSRPGSLSLTSETGVSIAKLPGTSQAPPQQMIRSSIASSAPRVSHGGFVPGRSQGHKDLHLFWSGTR